MLYNAAAVHVKMGNWDKARDILLAAGEDKGGARGGTVEAALDCISVSLVPTAELDRGTSKPNKSIQNRLNCLFPCL